MMSQRPATLASWLLVSAACCVSVVCGHSDTSHLRRLPGYLSVGEREHVLRAVQWNVHGSCFEECRTVDEVHCDRSFPACQNGARATVTNFLKDDNLDFIGLELFTDRSLFDTLVGWTHLEFSCGGVVGYGVVPFDVARLIYNSRRWEALGGSQGGCFDAAGTPFGAKRNYRAFVVQALQRIGTQDKMTVAVAHFPHPTDGQFDQKIWLLREAIAKVSSSASAPRTLLVADTNHGAPGAPKTGSPLEFPLHSLQVAKHLMDVELVHSTAYDADTCCFNDYWGGAIDRIIAMNFAKASMDTELPFHGQHVPFAARNMHDPIIGKLTYQ